MRTRTLKSFLSIFNERIEYLRQSNKFGTALNYNRAKNSLQKYVDNHNAGDEKLTASFIESYAAYLSQNGLVRNSISFHMRIIRAVYNKVSTTSDSLPCDIFRNVYTGVDKTGKRCIDSQVLASFLKLELYQYPDLEQARDLFFFSVYARGMAFVDIAFLKKSNIKGNDIVYQRRKTGKLMRIKIEYEMRLILNRYLSQSHKSDYVFDILKPNCRESLYHQYLNALSCYNYRLTRISEMLGLDRSLSSYTARHTWATLAYKCSIPLSVICAGMGHSSERITRIYLSSIDDDRINIANRMVLDRMLGEKQKPIKVGVTRYKKEKGLLEVSN
ncbi:MAG: site-specific integrase [Muribaculaceae bacterium]|nr:site-specific integrase [Muribaculaceae bacterium]